MYQNGTSSSGQVPSGGYGANQTRDDKPSRPMANFDALRALQGDDGSDDSDNEHGVGDYHSSDPESGEEKTARASSSDDEPQREVGKEATQEERDEAEQVIRKAFRDVKERDAMRSKVSTASPTDLQAMLNARLGKQSSK